MSAMSNSVSEIPARWTHRERSSGTSPMAIRPAVRTIVILRSSTFSDSCDHSRVGCLRARDEVGVDAHILHRLEDVFILRGHFHHGRDPLADARGDHRAAQHGASRSDNGLSAEWNDLVVAHVPDESDVVFGDCGCILGHSGIAGAFSAPGGIPASLHLPDQLGNEWHQGLRLDGLGFCARLQILDAVQTRCVQTAPGRG